MDREKLLIRIKDSEIPALERDLLERRLKVASSAGVAAVVRDFEAAMVKRRSEILASHRRHFAGRGPARFDKRMVVTSFKALG